MAQLIYDWLNDDVKLSRRINSLGDDFRDGYLIGELLARYNQQSNFNKFSTKGNPDAKINNFCLIEPTMRQVGVPFNSKIASDIMNAKEGAVKNLLYELKTALETISRNSRQSTNGSYGTDTILCVIAPSRPLYDRTMAITFENAIRAMIENPNEVMMESVTRRFREKKSDFRQSVSAGHTGMMDSIQHDLMRSKEIERHRKEHEGEFAEAWENINVDQWKTNQRVARERRDLKKRVEMGLTVRKESKQTAETARTRERTINSINDFDNRLEDAILASSSSATKGTTSSAASLAVSSLIKTIKQIPGSNISGPELVYIDQNVLREGLMGAQKKMKEHHEDGAVRQQANDRRRRRFIREFDTQQTRMSQGFFEKDVTTQLLNNSQSEAAESSALHRASSYRHIMMENRENRSQLMRNKADADRERNIEWRAVEARREWDWVVQADIDSQTARRQALLDAAACASRTQNDDLARDIVLKIVDVAEWVIACRTMGGYHHRLAADGAHSESAEATESPDPSSVLPDELWKDAAAMFTSSINVAQALPAPQPVRVTLSLKPFCIADRPLCSDAQWLFQQPFSSEGILGGGDVGAQLTQHLSSEETRHYIADLNVVDLAVNPVAAEEAGTAEEDLSTGPDLMLSPPWLLSSNTVPHYFLGEAIIAIRCAVDPVPEEPAPVVASEHIPLRAAICGLSDLARRRLADELQAKVPGLVVIRTEALVLQAWTDKVARDTPLPLDGIVEPEPEPEHLPVEEFESPATVNASPTDADVNVAEDEDMAEVTTRTPPVVAVDEEAMEALLEAARALTEEYSALCDAVHACLAGGSAITDELYVALIVCAIKRVPKLNNGFVVQDFPNTKKQALLLMEALSGTRYDLRKPQATDRMSVYAPHKPCEEVLYDIKKCGLDVIVYIDSASGEDSALATAVGERVRARKNLFTGAVEYLTEDCPSVLGLQEVFDASRPVQTSGIDLTVAQGTNAELQELFARFQILDLLHTADFSSLEEAAQSKAAQLCERFIPERNLNPNYLLGIVTPPEVEREEVDEDEDQLLEAGDGSLTLDAQDTANGDAPAEGEAVETRPRPPALRLVNAIPRKLAVSLADMWNLSEQQSQLKSDQYFTAFRDVRYQFVQRRRCAADCLSYMLVRLDKRQELFDEFRRAFNELDPDMRFDPDCAAELHLQVLELGDAIFCECEARKRAAQEYIKQVGADGVLSLAMHRCYAESAALVQAELNRFYVTLHLLFDYTKSVKGFEMQTRVLNEMEVTLPLVVPSAEPVAPVGKGGKDAPKKEAAPKKGGKEVVKALPVPFREPVPAVLLPGASLLKIPQPIVEMAVDPKAKKPKEKKGAADEHAVANPFEDIEALVQEDVAAKWARAVFAVNRDVYEGDEALSAALESAVWFEADKLLLSVSRIRANLASQVLWLEHTEGGMMAQLNDVILVRFHKELAAAKVLLAMATRTIEGADPMEELWLVAPDAMPPVNPNSVWRQFYDHLPEHRRQCVAKASSAPRLDSDEQLSQSLQLAIQATERSPTNQSSFVSEHPSSTAKQTSIRNAISATQSRPGSAPSDDTRIASAQLEPTSARPTSGTTGGGTSTRKSSNAGRHSFSSQDDAFRRQQEKYQKERKEFELSLQRRRREREEDFMDMGMAPGNAKLAAFNELILEEQHQMADFEGRNKPRPASAASQLSQRPKATRYGNLMNVARSRSSKSDR